MSATSLTRAVRRKRHAPWVAATAFFRQVLQRRDDEGEPLTDCLTCTNWFRSRAGTDGMLAADSDALGIERSLDPEAYEVTFFVVYDPREDLVYRIEAPYCVTRDETVREQLTTQMLAEIARERGPPLAVGKADELARIDRDGKQTLRERIETSF
jgi:hypothetical protein